MHPVHYYPMSESLSLIHAPSVSIALRAIFVLLALEVNGGSGEREAFTLESVERKVSLATVLEGDMDAKAALWQAGYQARQQHAR